MGGREWKRKQGILPPGTSTFKLTDAGTHLPGTPGFQSLGRQVLCPANAEEGADPLPLSLGVGESWHGDSWVLGQSGEGRSESH